MTEINQFILSVQYCIALQLQPVVWERIAECREEGGSLRCPEGFFWQESFF